jgi:hypothetical protein
MAFNATAFRNALKYGGARPNAFDIEVVFGSSKVSSLATAAGLKSSVDITMMANGSQMPGSIIGTVPLPYFGRVVNVSGDRVYEDWQCAIYSDEDFKLRNFFERWNNMMSFHNYSTNREHAIPGVNDYVCSVKISHYTKTGLVDKIVELKNAFPYMVSPIELNWQANDQVMMFEVMWKYDYFLTSWTNYDGKAITEVTESDKANS